jgi:hypothetical protein
MNDRSSDALNLKSSLSTLNRVSFCASLLMIVITIITFCFALMAIPISGANCRENCVAYPYLNTVRQYPRDFVWMMLAIILVLTYLGLMNCLHVYAPIQRKALTQIGISFALVAAVILLITYYVQFVVVPVSLMNNETEGLPLLIQYNPHGLFIALEELGYIMMSLSFLFIAPAFTRENLLSTWIRGIFIGGFVIPAIAFVGIMLSYGVDRQDRFEVIALSVDWLVLIVNGGLLAMLFRRRLVEGV